MNPDYQYLIDFEQKIKQKLAKANINYRSRNRYSQSLRVVLLYRKISDKVISDKLA